MAPIDREHNCDEPFQFYQCPSTGFLGCCTHDPCQLTWCSDFEKPPDSAIFWKAPDTSSAVYDAPATVTPIEDSLPSSTILASDVESSTVSTRLASSVSTREEPTPTAENAVITYASTETQQLYVVYQTSDVLITPIALAPTIVTHTRTLRETPTMTAMSANSNPSTSAPISYIVPDIQHSNTTKISTSQSTPFPLNHAGLIASVVLASLLATIACFFLIKACSRWNIKQKIRWMRRSQHDDHPDLAGTDANQAGRILSFVASQGHGDSASSTPTKESLPSGDYKMSPSDDPYQHNTPVLDQSEKLKKIIKRPSIIKFAEPPHMTPAGRPIPLQPLKRQNENAKSHHGDSHKRLLGYKYKKKLSIVPEVSSQGSLRSASTQDLQKPLDVDAEKDAGVSCSGDDADRFDGDALKDITSVDMSSAQQPNEASLRESEERASDHEEDGDQPERHPRHNNPAISLTLPHENVAGGPIPVEAKGHMFQIRSDDTSIDSYDKVISRAKTSIKALQSQGKASRLNYDISNAAFAQQPHPLNDPNRPETVYNGNNIKVLQNESKGRLPHEIRGSSQSLDRILDRAERALARLDVIASDPASDIHPATGITSSLPVNGNERPATTLVPVEMESLSAGDSVQINRTSQGLAKYVPGRHADEPFDETRSADFWVERENRRRKSVERRTKSL